MFGLGHERLSGPLKASSALPFRADLDGSPARGRYVPILLQKSAGRILAATIESERATF
jgi:hypothetical protein